MRLLLLLVCCLALGVTSPGQVVGPTEMIRIGVLKDGVYDVQTVPLEVYVARVLTGEALPGSAPAAYEALAVAIRTYTLSNRGRHGGDGFDLCDQTHCQVMRDLTPVAERAALATAGQVLLYRGQPASIFYSASCGGHTEKPSNVWPGSADPPYLPAHVDDGCGGMPAWSTELRLPDLQRSLAAAGYSGTLRNIRVATRTESGRVDDLVLEGMSPAEITGQDLRAVLGRTIGWRYVQSTAFDLTRSGDAFRFRGRGYGHGVGMCVIGSTKLAVAGESAHQILARYFPGTMIESMLEEKVPSLDPSASPVPVPVASPEPPGPPDLAAVVATAAAVVPVDVNARARRDLETLISQVRLELASALRAMLPPAMTLRIHESTVEYEKATGVPWFTQGVLRSGELHLVPIGPLEDSGMLERVVRREVVHAIGCVEPDGF